MYAQLKAVISKTAVNCHQPLFLVPEWSGVFR